MSRSIEIKAGSIDLRIDSTGKRVALVFEAANADLRLFRLMSFDEWAAFVERVNKTQEKIQ